MNEINTEKLVDKVRKLLALAGNNPNEAEANAAMLKAHKLIAEYNLDMSSCAGEKIEYAVIEATHYKNCGYRCNLAVVIARSCRCRTVMVGNMVNFFGRKEDAEACVEMFNYAYKVAYTLVGKLERQAYKEGRSAKGLASSYLRGFVHGVQRSFDAQCEALAVIVPQDVHDEFKAKYPVLGQYKGGQRNTGYDGKAYGQGLSDGKNVFSRKQLESV